MIRKKIRMHFLQNDQETPKVPESEGEISGDAIS